MSAASVASGAAAPHSAPPVRYRVDIQAVYDKAGNPVLVANFTPDGGLAKPRWSICPLPNTSVCRPERTQSQVLRAGSTRAGTLFQATAVYRGRTYTSRTAVWMGRLHATVSPTLLGRPRAGARVSPRRAAWAGGWKPDPRYVRRDGARSGGRGHDFDALSVEACRALSGRHCVNLTPQGRTQPFRPGPLAVTGRFVGWYLFAFDERLAADTAFAVPAYGNPAAIPPLEANATVVRSVPVGPVRRAHR